MKTNPNEPAYPRDHVHQGHNGVTKRELFAAMAMKELGSCTSFTVEYVAKRAVQQADALIEALNKE